MADEKICTVVKRHASLKEALMFVLISNALASVTKTQDKQGICHQLANVNRLVWV